MRKIEGYIIKNWIWIAAGLILTRMAVVSAFERRGRFCLGGEWLVLPTILLAVHLVSAIARDFTYIFGKEGDGSAGRTARSRRRMARKRRRLVGRRSL